MSKHWKWTLAAALFLALAVAVPRAESVNTQSADPTIVEHNLVALQVESDAQGRPVVTLDSDGPCEFESFVLDGPDRLVVDLPGVVSRVDQYKHEVGWGGVAQVRTAQHQTEPVPITRVVFDLEGPETYVIERSGDNLTVAFGRTAAEEPV